MVDPRTTLPARGTTANIKCSPEEKRAWSQAALDAGFTWNQDGEPRGNISKWLRHLASRETNRA